MSLVHSFAVDCGCFSAIGQSREIVTEAIWPTTYGPQSRNDSLSGPLQKMFADLWSRDFSLWF